MHASVSCSVVVCDKKELIYGVCTESNSSLLTVVSIYT